MGVEKLEDMVRKNLKLRRKILKNKLDNVEKTKFKMN
jgi:hypothetical protein